MRVFYMNKDAILTKVSAFANGEASVPTGDEYTQWSEFLSTANEEWNNGFDFQSMTKVYRTTLSLSGTSAALPSDFKEKFAGYIDVEGDKYSEYNLVEATITGGNYVTWGGNRSSGYYMNISKAVSEDSAVIIPYHSRVTSLTSPASISPCPDPEFLVMRTTELVFLNRGQPEYVEFQSKADLLLQRMVANEVSSNIQRNKQIRTQADYNGYTFGED